MCKFVPNFNFELFSIQTCTQILINVETCRKMFLFVASHQAYGLNFGSFGSLKRLNVNIQPFFVYSQKTIFYRFWLNFPHYQSAYYKKDNIILTF
ncbi:MAG TPA: hypothetical protein DDX39_08350 [Bacteroidales bacterium]|nr:MAG: hypothetical protein A2W98_09865 [Bacteroidetes bacterium GWF2_33_38]HBF88637.1 hypothetical protein [Bacteroidales bacterium]